MNAEGVLILVEDDPDLLDSWRDLFEFTGYTVHAYPSAQALLDDPDAVRGADLLITDYHLADRCGIDLIREARRIRADLPSMVLTGLQEPRVAEAVAAEPDVALFYKPVSVQVIDEAVQERLQRARAAG